VISKQVKTKIDEYGYDTYYLQYRATE